MNFGILLKNKLAIAFLIIFSIKLFLATFIPLDADEVLWSIMAKEMLNAEKFYLFFATQNFTGAFEAYILMPFQFLFGYSSLILRINSALWGTGTILLIYLLLKKLAFRNELAMLGSLFYVFMLPNNFYIHSKAWGNYVLTEFLAMLCLYLYLDILKAKKLSAKVFLIGAIIVFNFVQNMQTIYYVGLVIALIFIGVIYTYKKTSFVMLLADVIPLAFTFVNFYMFVNKKMLVDVGLTLATKFGVTNFLPNTFILTFSAFIFAMWSSIIAWELFAKTKNYFLRLYFIIVSFLFAGVLVAVKYNSFSRIAGTGGNITKNLAFLDNIILTHFLGDYWIAIIGFIMIAMIIRWFSIIKTRSFTLKDFLFFAVIFFPVLFSISSIPQLTMTSRYLIVWWPIICMALVYALQVILKDQRFILYAVVCVYILYCMTYFSDYRIFYNQYHLQKTNTLTEVGRIEAANYSYCSGDYWKVALIMFYSEMRIRCWNDKSFGWNVDYLDHYKKRHRNEPIYLVN